VLTYSQRKILFWLSVVAFIALIPVVILYALGYRLDDAWRLQKTGGISINADISGSQIYIDGKLQRTTNLFQNGVFVNNLSPGEYDVIVKRENYLDWRKNLEVRSQLVTEARALLVPEETQAQILLRGKFSNLYASEFNPVLVLSEEKENEKIVRWYLPQGREFLTDTGALLRYKENFEIVRWLPDGVVLKLDGKVYRMRFSLGGKTASSVSLGGELPSKTAEEIAESFQKRDGRDFVEIRFIPGQNILKADWVGEIIPPYFFSSQEEILVQNKIVRNFEIYPGRRDIVLASFDNGVWAIEIDGRSERAVYPIYKGREPNFVLLPNSDELYILDAEVLIEAELRAE